MVRDAKIASKVFIEFEKIGIINITIERLDNRKIVEFRKEVKINAIKGAKDKAQALAMAINQDIGRDIFIQEQDNRYQENRTSNSIMVKGYAGSKIYSSNTSDLDIDFEKIKLKYSIICRFELK